MESDPEPDPDPLVRGTDPGIRIRTKKSRIPNTAGRGLTRPRSKSPVVRGQERGHDVLWQRSGCQGTGKGTRRTLAEASQAPETKVRLSGDRKGEMTYLGRGITGPGDKGPVVRGQKKGHVIPWQRHHRPRRQRFGCQGTGRGT
jgi:hypothetical protein